MKRLTENDRHKYLLRKGDIVQAIRPMGFGEIKVGEMGVCVRTTIFHHCHGADSYVVKFDKWFDIDLGSCWGDKVEKLYNNPEKGE